MTEHLHFAVKPISAILVLLIVLSAPNTQVPATTEIMSVSTTGASGNGDSNYEAISADGRYVAFHSTATTLVPGDTNGMADVFVRDRLTQQLTRVSISSGGLQGDYGSQMPALSAEGRYVVFQSDATNLVPDDTNGYTDIFVRDTQISQTVRVSVSYSGGQVNGQCSSPGISTDGRYVVFETEATNVVPNDTNGKRDIFVRDLVSGQNARVSESSAGAGGNDASTRAAISAGGRYVAFESFASNLVPGDTNARGDVFVRDVVTGQTTRVSLSSTGIQGDQNSAGAAISGDGRYVAFHSDATNLVQDDTNLHTDVFVHDRQTGQTTRISVSSSGTQGNNDSNSPALSPDGRYVTFTSKASNLVSGDTNNTWDIFVRDLLRGWTTRVSVAYNGNQANSSSMTPDIMLGGRLVSFGSYATNLVPNDPNAHTDIFVRDRGGSNVLVLDDAAAPVAGAEVYHNGWLAGKTAGDGTLVIPDLQAGDQLVARWQVVEVLSAKGHHSQDSTQNWAYRVYITSLDIPTAGEPLPFIVADPNVTQVLTVRRANPLIGFNVVAAVEWNATAAYLSELRQGFEMASAYLYDASDGQMLFERISIYDDAQATAYWNDGDYQIWASNQMWPQADANGIPASATASVWLGRYFDGLTADQGPWTQPKGYRTVIHEFGHYGLGLYDSYFYLGAGNVKIDSHCTSAAIRTNATASINATLMDFQFNATEMAMQGVAGLWSPECLLTRQWQKHTRSDWEAIVQKYQDSVAPPRWTLQTPAAHGGVVEGPAAQPMSGWTQVETGHNDAAPICAMAPVITATTISGSVVPTATVTLFKSGRAIAQGHFATTRQLTVLGAAPGDRVHLEGLVAGAKVSGNVTVTCVTDRDASGPGGGMDVIVSPDAFELSLGLWPGSGADQVAVEVAASVPLSGTPQAFLQQNGETAVLPVALTYNSGLNVYTGTVTLDPDLPWTGLAWVAATDAAAHTVERLTSFDIELVDHNQDATFWSADGLAELYVPAGALSADARVGLTSAGLPGPAPAGLRVVGGPYAVRAAAGVNLASAANLSLFYTARGDDVLRVRLFGATLYRWTGSAWAALDSRYQVDHQDVSAPISAFGVYALMVSDAPIQALYLPAAYR